MSLQRKSWDQASYDALVKFAANGGAIRNVNSVKRTKATTRRVNWQGGKITVGFKLSALTDNPEE